MGEFRRPDFVESVGAYTYVMGKYGEPLGRGYYSYGTLSGKDSSGAERTVLVGIVGAVVDILDRYIFYPLQFDSGTVRGPGFWGYKIEDGTLYGYRQDPEDLTNLGVWPPEDAYADGDESPLSDEDTDA